jgi:hypothetical protein
MSFVMTKQALRLGRVAVLLLWVVLVLASYLVGPDEIRCRWPARQAGLGLIVPQTTPLAPRPQNVPACNRLSPKQQGLEDLRMAVYAVPCAARQGAPSSVLPGFLNSLSSSPVSAGLS